MISVCIATYNGERFIQEQIQSILPQLGKNDEVIVSDAGSTDHTVEVISRLNDKRITVLTYCGVTKPCKYPVFEKMDKIRGNFANALANAKGDYIFLADQDDVWMPYKLESCLKILQDFDCIVHNCEVWDGEKTLMPSFLDYMKPGKGILGTLYKSPFMGCCMAFNKKVLDYALPMPDIHIEHDTYIGLCAYKIGKVKIMKEPLIKYRRHGDNASPCAERSKNSLWVMFLRRYYMFISLFSSK